MATPSAAPQKVQKVFLFQKPISRGNIQDQTYYIDPYTGALASALDKNTFLRNLDGEIARLNPAGANSRLVSPQRTAQYESMKKQREYVAAQEWKQYEGLDASMQQYGSDWEKFFQAQYQNPRIAEERTNRRNRADQDMKRKATLYEGLQDLMVQANGMPSSKKVRNTGISSRNDTFGGALEAGLGV